MDSARMRHKTRRVLDIEGLLFLRGVRLAVKGSAVIGPPPQLVMDRILSTGTRESLGTLSAMKLGLKEL